MLTFEWNALRTGDHVAVHDDTSLSFALAPATVSVVQTAPGNNDVAVRVTSADGRVTTSRPRRMAVHMLPIDPDTPCWRCGTERSTTPH